MKEDCVPNFLTVPDRNTYSLNLKLLDIFLVKLKKTVFQIMNCDCPIVSNVMTKMSDSIILLNLENIIITLNKILYSHPKCFENTPYTGSQRVNACLILYCFNIIPCSKN